jgi:hypothetical protein
MVAKPGGLQQAPNAAKGMGAHDCNESLQE